MHSIKTKAKSSLREITPKHLLFTGYQDSRKISCWIHTWESAPAPPGSTEKSSLRDTSLIRTRPRTLKAKGITLFKCYTNFKKMQAPLQHFTLNLKTYQEWHEKQYCSHDKGLLLNHNSELAEDSKRRTSHAFQPFRWPLEQKENTNHIWERVIHSKYFTWWAYLK